MSIHPFNGILPAAILTAIQNDCSPDQIISIMFRAQLPPVRSLNEREQWLRLNGILAAEEVYDAFGIRSLPSDPPGTFYYSRGLETIGTIANLLIRGGVHRKFVADRQEALALSREFLDSALLRQYESVEAYSCHEGWCEWFIGERVLDETVLIGNRGEWWLLAITGSD